MRKDIFRKAILCTRFKIDTSWFCLEMVGVANKEVRKYGWILSKLTFERFDSLSLPTNTWVWWLSECEIEVEGLGSFVDNEIVNSSSCAMLFVGYLTRVQSHVVLCVWFRDSLLCFFHPIQTSILKTKQIAHSGLARLGCVTRM